ncbi:hypothetical protein PGIGA_G00198220 [Pangasianodon gigas]|uniref:Uncharacterized protein n=1 Tax=Pangasianodon gigas TaxID=30993 RepID=A0ACC5WD60_PANGG|nr:hypothetical protein [Pangasianodon gigas]
MRLFPELGLGVLPGATSRVTLAVLLHSIIRSLSILGLSQRSFLVELYAYGLLLSRPCCFVYDLILSFSLWLYVDSGIVVNFVVYFFN